MTKTYIFRRLLRFSVLALALMIVTLPATALIVPSTTPVKPVAESTAVAPLSNMSVEQFLALTPKKYKELTGEKLSLTQKISLKIAQKKIKRAVKHNEKIDSVTMANAVDTNDFNIGGFVLGLLLSVVGVLIAYLIGDSSVVKWAWIGFGVSLIIILLSVLL